jgi:hypothetical protein
MPGDEWEATCRPTSVQRGFYIATLHVLVWGSTAHLPEHPGDEGQ